MSNYEEELVALLSDAGFVAAPDEARELILFAHRDHKLLESLVSRRLAGEPLAWITGSAAFCGLDIHVDPGIYVPRWQSEPLARRAIARLPLCGIAIDLCTGSGAIARVLATARPKAQVLASDLNEDAVTCAVSNGVDAHCGDLFSSVPASLEGQFDLIVGVVPYVPTPALTLLPRDTFTFESALSYDGGVDGTQILRRILNDSPRFLRSGGTLLLELGGEQAHELRTDLARNGFIDVNVLLDDDGDSRGVQATFDRNSNRLC